jgi:hypothetical protein
MPVKTEQSFEESIHQTTLRLACDQRRIKCLGFRSVDEHKVGTLQRWGTGVDQQEHCNCSEDEKPFHDVKAHDPDRARINAS